MAKPTWISGVPRELAERRPVAERINDWFEIYRDLPDREAAPAGRAMYGLWRAVLPHRLSGEQHHSGLE